MQIAPPPFLRGEGERVIACSVDGVQSPAEVYEDFLVRWQFRPWTAVLLAEAGIQPGEHILDLATGTGIVAREAAPFVGELGRIVALDINPAMMAVGQSLPEPAGASIEWLEGDAAALPLPDATFDAVLCQQGLQYFADQPAAAAEVRRVLASGGRAPGRVAGPGPQPGAGGVERGGPVPGRCRTAGHGLRAR
jgi:SAM-dependent methyltransferase